MPTGATGTTITLEALYSGTPDTPLVAIIDPSSNVLVSGGVPAVGDYEGEYEYDYDIPDAGPAGTWSIVWLGTINGADIEATSTFEVTSPTITFPSTECPDAPMWVTAEEYVAVYSNASVEEAELAVQEASWLLWSLTGKQFHGIECRLDEYRGSPGHCRLRLEHQPVETVFSVERVDDCTDEATEVEGWCQLSGGEIRLCCRRGGYAGFDIPWWDMPIDPRMPCSCDNGIVRVQYRVGSNLPPGSARVTLRLANEFWKSAHGQSCSLPERVTNVTRQGVTWVMLDPLDFLEKGLTGIGSIDQWISGVNLLGYGTLIDPLIQPRLLSSELTGCGSTCLAV